MKASGFFSREQQDQILSAIQEAELATSGEIRVHIETSCTENPLDRAAWIFNRLGMDKTAERNGVLFYLAVTDRKFAVIGDQGIHSVVREGFWDEVRELLKVNFTGGRFTEGLTEGILLAGQQLKTFFPRKTDDINELPDTISFDTNETI
jgi:uncharacterized membrane protein